MTGFGEEFFPGATGKLSTGGNSGFDAAAIRQDMSGSQQAGVRGTPSFFSGLTGSDGSSVKTLRRITGAVSFAAFNEAFDSLLSAQKD